MVAYMKTNLRDCFEYLDLIDGFIDEYDELYGMAFCNIDYDNAIQTLRDTLIYIADTLDTK